MGKRRLSGKSSPQEKRQVKSRWTTWAVLVGLAAVVAALIVIVVIQSGSKAASGPSGSARVGETAPDFTLRLFNGQSVTLSSLKGKPVLVNFWGSS